MTGALWPVVALFSCAYLAPESRGVVTLGFDMGRGRLDVFDTQ